MRNKIAGRWIIYALFPCAVHTAYAETASLTISGTILPNTCSASLEKSSITLAPIYVGNLSSNASMTEVPIVFSKCGPGNLVRIKINATGSGSSDAFLDTTSNANKASNVGLLLFGDMSGGHKFRPTGTNPKTVQITTANQTLKFAARLTPIGNGEVVAGSFSTVITMSFDYY